MTPFEYFLTALVIVLLFGWSRAAKGCEKAEKDLNGVLKAQQERRRERMAKEEADLEWPEIIEL